MDVKGYESLAAVLKGAFDQASVGKGAERHADDKPFDVQPMQQIAARRGIGFILGQADKKSEEAQGMLNRGQLDAFEREILGAIVYLAGSVVFARGQAPVAEVEGASDDGGWHTWDGVTRTNRPIGRVEVRFRNGEESSDEAGRFSWVHGCVLEEDNIIAWRSAK